MTGLLGPLPILDYASALVFALTGALVASRARLDIVGFIFIACLTATGGGTLRDMMLNRTVFWIADPVPIAVAGVAAVVVFFTAHLLESRYRALVWLDACALAIAVPAGVTAAYATGFGWPIALIMGVVTGCMGGLMRDVVCNEVPLVLKQGEPYATSALAGAGASVLAGAAGWPTWVALLLCAGVTFGLRAGSIAFDWRLPIHRPRAPRTEPPRTEPLRPAEDPKPAPPPDTNP